MCTWRLLSLRSLRVRVMSVVVSRTLRSVGGFWTQVVGAMVAMARVDISPRQRMQDVHSVSFYVSSLQSDCSFAHVIALSYRDMRCACPYKSAQRMNTIAVTLVDAHVCQVLRDAKAPKETLRCNAVAALNRMVDAGLAEDDVLEVLYTATNRIRTTT